MHKYVMIIVIVYYYLINKIKMFTSDSFEYVLGCEFIQKTYPHIICEICAKPLVYPVMCKNCSKLYCVKCKNDFFEKSRRNSESIQDSGNSECTKDDECECFVSNEWVKFFSTNGLLMNGKGWIRRDLEQLEIYCATNKKYGCIWRGNRKSFLDHNNKCRNEYICCIFGCGDKINISDTKHYDKCLHFKSWMIDFNRYNCDSVSDYNEREKIKACIKYTSQKISKQESEIEYLKQDIKMINASINTNISKQNQVIKASLTKRQIRIEPSPEKIRHYYCDPPIDKTDNPNKLLEINLPDEDAIWSISMINNTYCDKPIDNSNVPQSFITFFGRAKRKALQILCDKYNLSPYGKFTCNDGAHGGFNFELATKNMMEKEINDTIHIETEETVDKETGEKIIRRKFRCQFSSNEKILSERCNLLKAQYRRCGDLDFDFELATNFIMEKELVEINESVDKETGKKVIHRRLRSQFSSVEKKISERCELLKAEYDEIINPMLEHVVRDAFIKTNAVMTNSAKGIGSSEFEVYKDWLSVPKICVIKKGMSPINRQISLILQVERKLMKYENNSGEFRSEIISPDDYSHESKPHFIKTFYVDNLMLIAQRIE